MNAYQILHQYFNPVGLCISKRDWYIKEDGTFSFHGIIDSLQGGVPTCIKGASHTIFMASANSPEEVVNQLFEMAKTNKLWFGSYNDYDSAIEWDTRTESFTSRDLTEEEQLRMNNSVY
jgi:hypothetical protein